MFNRGKGTKASIISVIVFVACCAIMIADFRLWYLPLAALPFLIYCNINYNGTWESKKVDDDAIKSQEEQPYSQTWPFSALEEEPAESEREKVQQKMEKRERRMSEYQELRAEQRDLAEAYNNRPPSAQGQ